MKLNKLISLILAPVSSVVLASDYAWNVSNPVDWSTNNNQAEVLQEWSYTGIDLSRILNVVKVGSSTSGKQRIYFETINWSNGEFKNTCSGEMEATTIKVNNQNVTFHRWCNKETFDGQQFNVLSFSPVTGKGLDFVVNQFKTKNTVTVDGVKYSAKGFTKVWNSYGGDSI